MFERVYIRLSPEDSRRLLEILYPGESDPLRHAWKIQRRRRRNARVVALVVLLVAAAGASLVWLWLAALLNH